MPNGGIHIVSDEQLEEIFVDPFVPSEDHRRQLLDRFRRFVDRVSLLGIPFEVWIDGSFATEKPEPDDVDTLFILDHDLGNESSPEVHQELEALFGETGLSEAKIRYGCHVFVITTDKLHEQERSYWRGWFGFTDDEKAKGIPCIKVGT